MANDPMMDEFRNWRLYVFGLLFLVIIWGIMGLVGEFHDRYGLGSLSDPDPTPAPAIAGPASGFEVDNHAVCRAAFNALLDDYSECATALYLKRVEDGEAPLPRIGGE